MTTSRSQPPTAAAPDPGAGPAAYGHLRQDAIARLRVWPAPDREQEALRQAYLVLLEREEGAMSRSGPPAHLTGSVIVLDPAGDRALLTLHQKARRWFQFGGHFESGDTTMWHGAAREAREESGIDGLRVLPDIVQLHRHELDRAFGHCREHLDVRYAAVAPVGWAHVVSEESLDVRWWPTDALPEDTRDELLPLVRAAQRLIRR